ncbi:helix-turn-helix transcriptional regulator [Corynebacterium callunae]|uniref:AraC family transcriptional regulator n=1 Tax=Corynebacterium callunae TaxID=1721 RepID=UPI00398288DC
MNTASLIWCSAGTTTIHVADASFLMVAGDLLYVPNGIFWQERDTALILEITCADNSVTGPARRMHLGKAWNERLIFEYSRSLLGEHTLSPEIKALFQDRISAPPLPTPRKARAVAQVLASNPADQTSLEDFATQQGVSARTLQRQFLQSTGLSFSEWRAAQRVFVASSLLAHDFSIAVAANLVGFAATSSLTRAFRRHTGTTPSAFSSAQIGMGTVGRAPHIPAQTTFAEALNDQQLWIHSGTATVTTDGYCRFLGQGDMATIPAGTHTRIDVAAGSIALPVPIGVAEAGMNLDRVVNLHKQQRLELRVVERPAFSINAH